MILRRAAPHEHIVGALPKPVPNARKFVAEEYRRVRLLKTDAFLSRHCPQEIGLDELDRAFARADEAYPSLSGWIYINEVSPPRGPGSLEFFELAKRAVSVLVGGTAGESDWKRWLEVLLAYLLQNDMQQEFLGIYGCGHFEGPAGTTSETHPELLVEGENCEIRRLFKVSEHCCKWLKRRYAGASGGPALSRGDAEPMNPPSTCSRKEPTLKLSHTRPYSPSAVGLASGNMNRLQQIMAERGLTAPKLAAKICAELRRNGRETTVDRTTIYRLITGQTKSPKPAIWAALLAVLKLPEDETLESMIRRFDQ